MFVVSKLLSAITQPLFWLALWWLLALLLLGKKPRAAKRMLWSGLVLLGVLGFQALPDALLRALERRYPPSPWPQRWSSTPACWCWVAQWSTPPAGKPTGKCRWGSRQSA